MNRITVGVDNGQSGSIGIVGACPTVFVPVPTKDYLHYGKKGSIGQRLDRNAFRQIILNGIGWGGPNWVGTNHLRVYIERPFSGKFINAVVPAHRFFEATIIVMEEMFRGDSPIEALGYEVVDSGPWQKGVLGNVTGSKELKLASKLRGEQLYPQLGDVIRKHGDADGLLIAHYYHNLAR